jgi:hypothetical protein
MIHETVGRLPGTSCVLRGHPDPGLKGVLRRLLICLLFLIPPMEAVGLDDVAAQDAQDSTALRIARSTMEAMGGEAAWMQTRAIRWNFFGMRTLVWDKHTGQVRIEMSDEAEEQDYVLIVDLNTKEGAAWIDGQPVADPERRAELLDRAEAIWINDSYWLFMPYKLMDPGVNLRYLGEIEMEDQRAADVLELSFEDVGRTPRNKYDVYVAKDSGLVEQWSFYRDRDQEEPDFTTPWHGWRRYGKILLCGDRGQRQITEIQVFDEVDPRWFTEP